MMLKFNFNNMMADSIGPRHGITEKQIDNLQNKVHKAFNNLDELRKGNKVTFFNLPYQREEIKKINLIAKEISARCDNFVVLGIGGSALGNIALHNALHQPFYNFLDKNRRKNLPRMFFIDNIDPDLIDGLCNIIDMRKTIFNVITKSGNTAETMANFLIFRDKLIRKLGRNKFASHIIATTDLDRGSLRQLIADDGYESFDVPKGVGGRYSVLSPVGLLSAAVSGINIDELLAGARKIDKLCQKKNLWENPALLSAALLYLMNIKKNKQITVMMPYSNRLKDIADWFRQLWAESLGKKYSLDGKVVNTGLTPVKALGATDQHSQLQLYIEGPNDKVVIFLRVEKFDQKVGIPRFRKNIKSLEYLNGRTLNQLIDAEQQATEDVLAKNARPNYTITLPAINEDTIGQLIFLLEMQTAFAGSLYNINAFDQPAVEGIKTRTRESMRRGSQTQRKKIP